MVGRSSTARQESLLSQSLCYSHYLTLVCYLQCKVERREAKMPKKATILAVVLILFVAAPASAQQGAGAGQEKSSSRTIAVTGVIEKPEITSYMYGSHAITDEASGKRYALRSE